MKKVLLLLAVVMISCTNRKNEIRQRQLAITQLMKNNWEYKVQMHDLIMRQQPVDTVKLFKVRDKVDSEYKALQIEYDSLDRELQKLK